MRLAWHTTPDLMVRVAWVGLERWRLAAWTAHGAESVARPLFGGHSAGGRAGHGR